MTSWLSVTRKIVVAIAGLALLIGGLALLVLPGPGLLLIFLSVLLLATEFRSMAKFQAYLEQRLQKFRHFIEKKDEK